MGAEANSAWEARKPRAGFHQFQVINHKRFRHGLCLPPSDNWDSELRWDGSSKMQAVFHLCGVPYSQCMQNLASRVCSGPLPPSEVDSPQGREFCQYNHGCMGAFPTWGRWSGRTPNLVGAGKQEVEEGEGRVKYGLANTTGHMKTCTVDLTKALNMKRSRLALFTNAPLNEQENGQCPVRRRV